MDREDGTEIKNTVNLEHFRFCQMRKWTMKLEEDTIIEDKTL